MLYPAAMFIEMAADGLKELPDVARNTQQQELTSFGDGRAQQMGASGLSPDFRKGYELGLQTARAVLAMNAALVLKGVDPRDVL